MSNEPAFPEAPHRNADAERRHPDAMPSRAAIRRDAAEQAARAEAEATQRVLRSYQRDHHGNALIGSFRDDHGHQVAVILSQTGVVTIKHGAWTALQLHREQATELVTLLERVAKG